MKPIYLFLIIFFSHSILYCDYNLGEYTITTIEYNGDSVEAIADEILIRVKNVDAQTTCKKFLVNNGFQLIDVPDNIFSTTPNYPFLYEQLSIFIRTDRNDADV